MRNQAVLITTLGFVLSLMSMTSVFAQQPNNPALGVALVRLLQGQEINLPEDFVARLDGESLKVALKSMGLSEKYPNRDLLVFLIQEDNTTSELSPDENGEVVFYNVKEGLAAIVIASGQVAYAAMAVYAERIAPAIDQTVSPFEVAVGSVETNQIRTGVEAAGHAPMGESAKRLTDYPKRAVNRFRVYLRSDGLLPGHVVVPEAGFERSAGSVNLSFFRDGVMVARTVSANDGSFLVSGLQPGMHTVFASGPPGHASFAFEVVAPKAVSEAVSVPISRMQNGAKNLLVSAQVETLPAATDAEKAPVIVEPADELIVLLIPPRLMPEVREIVARMYPLPAGGLAGAPPFFPGFGAGLSSFGGGGFGGGFGGGGGGGLGGGLGGLGGLLGAAGLAVGVVAIADDDNDNRINLPLATDVSPNLVRTQ